MVKVLEKSLERIAIYILEIMYFIFFPDRVNEKVSHLALGISQKW